MRGTFYSKETKERVRKLLLDGKSYNEVFKLSGVPKSTISTWFGKNLKRPIDFQARKKHFLRIHKLASLALKKKYRIEREREQRLLKEKIAKELTKYPLGNKGFYKSLLAMLYWAEGSKYEKVSGLQFVNIDPKLIILYITLLRKCYNIDENKFRIKLHLHYYHSINRSKQFWSKTLGVPMNQFNKVYIKKRSKTKKFRKNFAGICLVNYGNSGIRKELIEIGSALQEYLSP